MEFQICFGVLEFFRVLLVSSVLRVFPLLERLSVFRQRFKMFFVLGVFGLFWGV